MSIPHRTGPIHVVGVEADKIYKNATEEAKEEGIDLWNVDDFYVKDNKWQDWLPRKFKYDLVDPSTGLITNLDGKPSAQVSAVLTTCLPIDCTDRINDIFSLAVGIWNKSFCRHIRLIDLGH